MLQTVMEDTRTTEPQSPSWVSRRRDKAVMAWRHRSRNEKTMLRVIAFLSFTLLCFIIAVIAMDLTYKAKIKNLKNQIDNMKTTPQAIVSTSDLTDLTSDLTDSTSDVTDPSTTTTTPTTIVTTPTPTTTPDPTTTLSTTIPPTTTSAAPPATTVVESTSSDTSTAAYDDPGLLESLQSLLLGYSGRLNSKKTWEKSNEVEGVVMRTHATFAILADIHHEESKPLKKESNPIKTSDSQNDTVANIHSSSSVPSPEKHDNTSEITTESSRIDYEMNDTEDEDYWEGLTGQKFPIDDSSAPHEGSGAGATPP